jgi:folate-binding Fe-S cluster repair protein YgfZ
VARVHFRGHVNRTLRRVEYPDGQVPAIGTSLVAPDGAALGDARSTVEGKDGRWVGLAMLRREVAAGATLSWLDGLAQSHQVAVIDEAAKD